MWPGQWNRWDWKIRSYEGDRFCLETVHIGDHSRDMEITAIRRLGRRFEIWEHDRERHEWVRRDPSDFPSLASA